MQYFISIENSPYFHWQAELLIQSFKHLGLQDQLFIAITNSASPKGSKYCKNLLEHPHKFVHVPAVGPVCANKFLGLICLLGTGALKKPFAVLHPDMILTKALEEPTHSLTYHSNQNADVLKLPYDERLASIFQVHEDKIWIPLGDVMIFNEDIPDGFFATLYNVLIQLAAEHGENPPWKLERAAWLFTIYDYFKKNGSAVGLDLERSLMDETNAPVIHYTHGMPPVFSKYHFKSQEMIIGDPLDILYENNVSKTTNYIHDLIDEYRR